MTYVSAQCHLLVNSIGQILTGTSSYGYISKNKTHFAFLSINTSRDDIISTKLNTYVCHT